MGRESQNVGEPFQRRGEEGGGEEEGEEGVEGVEAHHKELLLCQDHDGHLEEDQQKEQRTHTTASQISYTHRLHVISEILISIMPEAAPPMPQLIGREKNMSLLATQIVWVNSPNFFPIICDL